MLLKQLFFVCFLCISFGFLAQEDTLKCDQACHCIRNLTPAGVMISHVHPKGEWMVSYRYMQMQTGSPNANGSTISPTDVFNSYLAYTPSMQMNMHMLMGMVGITNRLTAMVMVNYQNSSMEMNMFAANTHTMNGMSMSSASTMKMNTQGLGDTKFQLLYGIIKNDITQLVLNLGASIPTGSIQQKGLSDDMFYPSTRLPYMMQLGSGTIDVLPGITFVQQQGELAYNLQAQGNLRTHTNSVGYRFGNELNASVWLGYNWWKGFGSTIRLEGNYSSGINGADRTIYKYNEVSANPSNYGGTRIQGHIGLSYQFEEGFITNNRLAIEAGLPIYQNINGIQNKLIQTWIASWSYSF